MPKKLEIEPLVKKIFQDYSTQLLIQQELQDIYDCINIIQNSKRNIIYLPEEQLELLEEKNNLNKLQEDLLYEDI
jgi:hypothetical protein